jgi:hypothetical protein
VPAPGVGPPARAHAWPGRGALRPTPVAGPRWWPLAGRKQEGLRHSRCPLVVTRRRSRTCGCSASAAQPAGRCALTPAGGLWRRPPLAGQALPRQARWYRVAGTAGRLARAGGHARGLGMTPAPSAREVWRVRFFCVPPYARSPARPFHTSLPQGPSHLIQLQQTLAKIITVFYSAHMSSYTMLSERWMPWSRRRDHHDTASASCITRVCTT